MAFKKDQLVWVETDMSMGPLRITDDTDNFIFQTEILSTGESRHYTKRRPPFKRVQIHVGQKLVVKIDTPEGPKTEEVTVESLEQENELYYFKTELGAFSERQVTGLQESLDVLSLLRQEKFSPVKAFLSRQEAWDLLRLREGHFLKGAVGCRVELLAHQLWVVNEALQMTKIRALLADEVGLGKTIEAGLIFSALHARQKLKKVLILVPPALKVQWLTESYRRFNIRFRLDHESLIADDEFRDFIIASFEEFEKNITDFDLLIVDEAHRLAHDSERLEQLAQIIKGSKHVLFLSATPRVHGEKEFGRMMELLGDSADGPVQPLVFQSKRSELGLPCYRQVEAVFTSDKKKWILDFLKEKLGQDSRGAGTSLASKSPLDKSRTRPKATREKVFLIASKVDDVVALHAELTQKLGQHFALFHEKMDLIERDRQAAYFADPDGAPFLLSSEIGGEGRNFQFCHHMVLVDLPADPLVVEQRIGRLDRLGQTQRVSVWCPILESNPAEEQIFQRLRDDYKVFEKPWSGSGLEDLAASELLAAKDKAALLESLRKPYDENQARALLASAQKLSHTDIKKFLDELYDLFGIEVDDFDTRGNWRVFTSSLMFVDYFPALGESGERVFTFDRAQALAREDMTFFSIDHPEFIESIEFLHHSEVGKVALGYLPPVETPDVLLGALLKSRQGPEDAPVRIWSCRERRELKRPEWLKRQDEPAKKIFKIPGPALTAILKSYQEFQTHFVDAEVDALLILVPYEK